LGLKIIFLIFCTSSQLNCSISSVADDDNGDNAPIGDDVLNDGDSENEEFQAQNEADLPPEVADPNLSPHGQVWHDLGEVTIDVGVSNRRTRLLWPGNVNLQHDPLPIRTELDYFKLMFPMNIVETMLVHTNELLATHRKPNTTLLEMFKYFGIRLNMTLDKTGCPIEDFWMTEEIVGSTFVPPNYGRFGMTRHRFQTLSRCMRFADYDEGVINEVRLHSILNHFLATCLIAPMLSSGSLGSHTSVFECI
jgi:hypothetical protein